MSGQHCYLCATRLREGQRIGGWVEFYYGSYPVCVECAGDPR